MNVGDDISTHPNSEILAHGSIDVFGDAGDADPGFGTNVILRGNITSDCTVTPAPTAPDSGYPVGICTPSTATHTTKLTQIWGNNDVDFFQLGDPSGLDTNPNPIGDTMLTLGAPGYIFFGAKTIVRGSNNAVTAGDPGHDPSVADGEDHFTVWYLQSMDVITAARPVDEPARALERRCRRRSHPDPRRPGGHRLLHRLHHRQPRLAAQLRRPSARHRCGERRRGRARRLRLRQHVAAFNGYVARNDARTTRPTTSSCSAR